MATNEEYRRGIKIPLTVGASVAARTPMCVGKLPVVTLTKTLSSGTQVATCLAKGACDLLVDSACDAVTLSLATVTAGQTVIANGYTYTAHGTVNTWSTRTFSIAGADTADALLLAKAINGGQIITLTSVTAGQTVAVAGLTFTAHSSTTTAANREFSISGADAADATELAAVLNDATYGIVPRGYIATAGGANQVLVQPVTLYPTAAYPTPTITPSAGTMVVTTLEPMRNVRATAAAAVVTLTSSEVISSITGTAQGATITVDHAAVSTRPVSQGDRVYWTSASTLNCKAETGTAFFGKVIESGRIEDRKITLATVTNGQTVIINGIVFTAHTDTTTYSTRNFKIDGDNTADAVALAACINHPLYGLRGFTATAASGTITLEYDGDIAVTGTARIGGTVTTAPGARTVQVKLGY